MLSSQAALRRIVSDPDLQAWQVFLTSQDVDVDDDGLFRQLLERPKTVIFDRNSRLSIDSWRFS